MASLGGGEDGAGGRGGKASDAYRKRQTACPFSYRYVGHFLLGPGGDGGGGGTCGTNVGTLGGGTWGTLLAVGNERLCISDSAIG